MAPSRAFLLRLLRCCCCRPRHPISRKLTSTMAAIQMRRGRDSRPAQPRAPDSSGFPSRDALSARATALPVCSARADRPAGHWPIFTCVHWLPSLPLEPVFSQSFACRSTSRSMDASARRIFTAGWPQHALSPFLRRSWALSAPWAERRTHAAPLFAPGSRNGTCLDSLEGSRERQEKRETRLCASGHGSFTVDRTTSVLATHVVPCTPRCHASSRHTDRPQCLGSPQHQLRAVDARGPGVSPHNIGSVCAALCGDIEIRPMTKILSRFPEVASLPADPASSQSRCSSW